MTKRIHTHPGYGLCGRDCPDEPTNGEPATDAEPVSRVVEVIVDPIPVSDLMALTEQWEEKHGPNLQMGPGRWSRMVVRTPGRLCGCQHCESQEASIYKKTTGDWASRMFIVCDLCGNKRCPRATHHDQVCRGSNEPGQPGSSYL